MLHAHFDSLHITEVLNRIPFARGRANSMFHLTESEMEMHKASNQIKKENQALSAPGFSYSALFQQNQFFLGELARA